MFDDVIDLYRSGVQQAQSVEPRRRRRARRRLRRWAATFLVCTALSFGILHAVEYSGPSYAAANFKPLVAPGPVEGSLGQVAPARTDKRPLVEIATTASPTSSNAILGRTSIDAAWLLLGLALSAILALNAMLLGHLRRNYARTWPGAGRRPG